MKCLLLLLPLTVWPQSRIDAPPLLTVLDADSRLTAVYGVAGSFIPGEPAEALLAYSNDGQIEWRLAPGRLSATRNGQTVAIETSKTSAIFRGATACFPEGGVCFRLESGDLTEVSSDGQPTQLAGRSLTWQDGRLRLFQPDGQIEEIPLETEPVNITAAAAEWLHLRTANGSHLLRITPGRAKLYDLPAARRPVE